MKVVAAHEGNHLRAASLVRLVAGLDHLLSLLGVNSSPVVLGERQHRRLERLALQRRRVQRIIPEAAAVVGFLLVVHLLRQLAARRDEVNVLRHARQQLARHACQPHSSPDHLVKLIGS